MLANKKVGLKLEGGVLVLWKKYVQFRKICIMGNNSMNEILNGIKNFS